MNTRITLLGLGLITAFVFGCTSPRLCILTKDLKPTDITGSWIGYDQDCLLFYRLTFAEEGNGLCVTLFVDDTPDVHHIKKWELKDGLSLELVPATSGAEPIAMSVVAADPSEMRVQVKGVERSWSHQALLHREEDVLKRTKMAEQVARKTEW